MTYQQASAQVQQTVQQIVTGPDAPKGDWTTIGAILLTFLDVLPQVAAGIAGILAIVWWVLRIRYARKRSREATELHDKQMRD